MAYDKLKAHEYYVNYRKKGLLKGRGNGKKDKTKGKKGGKAKKTALTGVSMSGLTDEGKLQAELIKNSVGKEMSAALAKAKTDEDKIRIKHEYQQKAKQQIEALKSDPKYGTPKAGKGGGGSSKGGSSGKSSASGGKSSSGSGSSGNKAAKQALNKNVQRLNTLMSTLTDKIGRMSPKMREQTKKLITDIMAEIKKQAGKI